MNKDTYVPGMFICDKCGFGLTHKIITYKGICVNTTQIEVDCPNCKLPMRSMLWKEYAQDLEKTIEKLYNERYNK